MSVQAINRCSKPFKYDFLPFHPSSSPSSSRLKRDTHQLCDRSRDGRSIDPEGGRGGEGGGGGREEGEADVAEKLHQVSQR